MKYAQEHPDGSITLVREDGPAIIVDGVQWPSSVLTNWSTQELSASGLYRVVPFTPAPGREVTGDPSYHRVGEQVFESYSTVLIETPVPESITRRQLILAMYLTGYMTGAEAEAAAASGEVPQFIADEFDEFTEDEVRLVKITWASMDSAFRHDPTMILLMDKAELTEAQRDDYFKWAATL